MRLRISSRLTPAAVTSVSFIALTLIPSLWVSWQASLIRETALPAMAILALIFLLRRERGGAGMGETGAAPTCPASPTRGAFSRHSRLASPADGLRSYLLSLFGSPAFPVLLLLGWAAASAVRAGTERGVPPGAGDFARGELLRLAGGVAVYLAVATTARRWERARQWVDALLWAIVGATAMAFLTHDPDDPVLIGPFGNPQLLAALLIQLLPLALIAAAGARNRRRRTVAQVAAVLALAALALTQARSAWLGGLVGLITLVVLYQRLPPRRRRHWSRERACSRPETRGVSSAPAAAVVALTLVALGWLVCRADLTAPVATRAATLVRLGDDQGLGWRVRQWRVALAVAQEQPLIGHGLGSYPMAAAARLPQPIPPQVARAVGPNLSLNAHNLYLQLLAETGAIGLGLYLWTLAAFFTTGLRACRRREHRSRSLVLIACMAAITGQMVDGLANPAYQFVDVSLFFWAILGLGTAMAQRPQRSDPSPDGLPVPYLLRLAGALTGAGVLTATSVAGAPPPVNQPNYVPYQALRVEARTTPGYLRQTLLPGECVELRAVGTLESGETTDATSQCRFARAGGTSPADNLQQLAAPHANLFCVPPGVPARSDGRTVELQGTLDFNGQTLTALAPVLTLSVPRACPGVTLTATPQVVPPTGEMVAIRVQHGEADLQFQRLLRVESNEPIGADDVQILDDTLVLLRAISSVPGQRIYTLRYRFLDRHHRTWVAPVQVYVR